MSILRFGAVRASLANISWLTLDNLTNTATNAAVGFVVARHFGVEQFGIWSYAFAIYTFAYTAVTLGLDELVVAQFSANLAHPKRLLVTALILRASAGLLGMLVIYALFLLTPHPHLERALMLVLAANLVLSTPDVIGAWLRAQSAFKAVALPSIASCIVANAVKLLGILLGMSIVSLSIASVVQMALFEGTLILILARSRPALRRADYDHRLARDLLHAGTPLMVASVAPLIYTRLNVVLIDMLSNKADVGIYSAATRISSMLYFVPMVIFLAMAPTFYALHRTNRDLFYKSFRVTLSIYFIAFAALCLAVSFFANPIIAGLYGPAYAAAAPILAIHIWTIIPVGYGVISAMCLLAEGLTRVTMVRTLVGGVINIVLTLLLVHRVGIIGAAIAALVSMLIASIFYHAFAGRRPREIFRYQIGTLLLRDIGLSISFLRGQGLR